MEALEGCDNLRVLELGYNPFGEEGIKALADVLKYKLQVLPACMAPPSSQHRTRSSVSEQPCCPKGLDSGCRPPSNRLLVVIGTSIVSVTYTWRLAQVDTLKVGWCKIGDGDGAKALADLLMFNQTLSTVDLRGNILVRFQLLFSHPHCIEIRTCMPMPQSAFPACTVPSSAETGAPRHTCPQARSALTHWGTQPAGRCGQHAAGEGAEGAHQREAGGGGHRLQRDQGRGRVRPGPGTVPCRWCLTSCFHRWLHGCVTEEDGGCALALNSGSWNLKQRSRPCRSYVRRSVSRMHLPAQAAQCLATPPCMRMCSKYLCRAGPASDCHRH